MKTEWLSISEAAARLGIKPVSVRARLHAGTMKRRGKGRNTRVAVPVNRKAEPKEYRLGDHLRAADRKIFEELQFREPTTATTGTTAPTWIELPKTTGGVLRRELLAFTAEQMEKLARIGLKTLLDNAE